MRTITERQIKGFTCFLTDGEWASATVKMYVRTVEEFTAWLDGREVAKETAVAWKEHLMERDYTPATVNVKLAEVNAFLSSAASRTVAKKRIIASGGNISHQKR